MNKIFLMGRLTKDPEVTYTQDGKIYARFTVAVDRPPNKDGKKEADFLSCVAWSKTAELVGNHFTKGKKILVEGRLRTGSYKAKDGTKRFTTDVFVERIEFVESKGKDTAADFDSMSSAFTEEIPF